MTAAEDVNMDFKITFTNGTIIATATDSGGKFREMMFEAWKAGRKDYKQKLYRHIYEQ